MGVKSVIDIELNDAAFTRFKAVYDKYQAAVKGDASTWATVNKNIDGSRKSFEGLVNQQIAMAAKAKLVLQAQREAERRTRSTADSWRGMARDTKDVASNISRATTQLLKWGSLTGVFTSLLGAGGLFGIDRMAQNVASGRRSSMGLGVSYGQQQAFGTNFGRFVDPGAMLASVSNALHDITSRGYVGLLAGGASQKSLQGGNAADVSAELLKRLPQIFAGTPQHLIGAKLKSLGLDEMLSQQDVVRYLASSPAERNKQAARYSSDSGRLNIDDSTGRAWQDFTTQMLRAGQGIENVFVKGLVKLEKPLEELSSSFEKTVRTFVESDTIKKWIGELGTGLEKFATYITDEKFQRDVKDFVTGVGELAASIVKAMRWLGIIGSPAYDAAATPYTQSNRAGDSPDNAGQAKANGWLNYLTGANPSGRPVNNPGNLRMPGKTTGFAAFPTEEAGLKAMAKQLQLYANRDKLDTLSGIISKYAPKSENDTASYIGNVSRMTGYKPDQRLDLNDTDTLAKVIAAMTKIESRRDYTPQAIVQVLNNTGGNAIVTTSQVAQ